MQASLYNHFNALGLRYSSHYFVLRKICIIYVTASGLRKCLARHQQTSKHELYMIMRLLILHYVLHYLYFSRKVSRINLSIVSILKKHLNILFTHWKIYLYHYLLPWAILPNKYYYYLSFALLNISFHLLTSKSHFRNRLVRLFTYFKWIQNQYIKR